MKKLAAIFILLNLTLVFVPSNSVNAMDYENPDVTDARGPIPSRKYLDSTAGPRGIFGYRTKFIGLEMQEQEKGTRKNLLDILDEHERCLTVDPQKFESVKPGTVEKYIEIKQQHCKLLDTGINLLQHKSLISLQDDFFKKWTLVINSPELILLFAKRIAIKEFAYMHIAKKLPLTIGEVLGLLTINSLPSGISTEQFNFYQTVAKMLRDENLAENVDELEKSTLQLKNFETNNSTFITKLFNEAIALDFNQRNQSGGKVEAYWIPDWPLVNSAAIPRHLLALIDKLKTDSQKYFNELMTRYYPGKTIA